MDYIEFLEKHQPLQNLNTDSPYQVDGQPSEVIISEELVQVNVEKLKY